ncbi:hypothetical protein [Hymenobacter cellulosivorans]|uniref:Uncharacterized protein n=1 Tax=Hymenobacter cellulosivorans TaxID=2932249 RepID=A0ABY4F3A8_9BACT|nr:hypothetical protein [Hymenobacter cellulosivorans]UOQ51142.1 hypothetical protein MUN80_15380 [Hymenobacter cellulosivorans]
MLTKRASLLTILGLLTTYMASAQTAAASGPQPIDILGWLAWFVAAVVLIFGVMTASSLAAVAAEAAEADLNDKPATPVHVVAQAPVATPPSAAVPTEQLVAA